MSDGSNGIPRGIPMFPLNTDGIDVKGQNITVRNCTVTNFDDAVCLKPTDGSAVPPFTCRTSIFTSAWELPWAQSRRTTTSIACAAAISSTSDSALKGIYVKPNPGTGGRGVIDNITYENIYGRNTLWWPVWISTQQQHQPGGSSTGCSFLFPVEGSCPTDPFVPVTNLHFKNVTLLDSLFSEGVMRCNASGPCTGWTFEDVLITSVTHWPVGSGFLCDGIFNSSWRNVVPSLDSCFGKGGV